MLDEKKLQEVADSAEKDPDAPELFVHGRLEKEDLHEDVLVLATVLFVFIVMAWIAYTS
jgi:hypothetical protein